MNLTLLELDLSCNSLSIMFAESLPASLQASVQGSTPPQHSANLPQLDTALDALQHRV